MNLKNIVNNFLANKYLAVSITLVIWVLCTLPSKNLEMPVSLSDKMAHFIAFGAWAFCWQAAFGRYTRTLLLGILYGIAIEFWQGILPESFHRGFEWYDALADGIGVVIGLILWKLKSLLNL